ncbi:MFS transporter [Fructilactobacillus cliffordii]|uniref:MFS transporter n=1 Tax=Fructilactobacillus cliffordii TaxID=2940299 RepID=A0A9Q8ZSE4_9LACO|nr:MFS transporter [Fructilactobacillus cliffordii]USS89652.1 MFS transporter [Fructilactobacillus cliffordii]
MGVKARFTRIINILFCLQILHLTLFQFSLFQSTFLIVQLIMELPAGIISDLVARRKIIVSGLMILSISPLIMVSAVLLAHPLLIILLSATLEGLGNALLSGSDTAYFFEALRTDHDLEFYDRIRGQVQLVTALVTGIATFVGGFLFNVNFILPYIAQTGCLLLTILLISSLPVEPKVRGKQNKTDFWQPLLVFRSMFTNKTILATFLLTGMITAVVNAIFSFMPQTVAKIGYSATANGLIFMLFSFVGGLVATQSYRLLNWKITRIMELIIVMIGIGFGLQLQSLPYLFLCGLGILYVTVDFLDPLVMTILNNWVRDRERATFLSGLTFLTTILTVFVNPLVSVLMTKLGVIAMLGIMAGFTSLAIITMIIIFKLAKPKK